MSNQITEVKEESPAEREQGGEHGGRQHFGGGRGRGGPRFGGRGGRPRGGGSGGDGPKKFEDRRPRDGGRGGDGRSGPERVMQEKLDQIRGATYDLPALDTSEKKFSGRSRLYIGNIPPDAQEDEITALFNKYGETSEVFLNKEKNFGFVRMDYRFNAEKAKGELDGTVFKGRTLKIRFAPNGATLKVKNLDEYVTNELLHMAFSVFGEVDRSVVIVDDRGKPTGEGIVEFSRKPSAQFAIRKCAEGCFFLTGELRPVMVEQYDALDEFDGYPDKMAQKANRDFFQGRSIGPRFAAPNSFEHEYGLRWKQLFELYAQKQDALKKEMELDREKLIAQMEYARYEHETAMLREQLRAREMDMDRQKREWESRQRDVEQMRVRQEEQMRRREDEMRQHMLGQEEEMRRRQQENSLFMTAQQLDSLVDQEGSQNGSDRPFTTGPDDATLDPKTFLNAFSGEGRFEAPPPQRPGMGGRGGRWNNDNRGGPRDDFQNKRRRF